MKRITQITKLTEREIKKKKKKKKKAQPRNRNQQKLFESKAKSTKGLQKTEFLQALWIQNFQALAQKQEYPEENAHQN